MKTIVAISTAPGVGGIGIIRLSGDNAFDIVNCIFKPKNKGEIKGYSIKYGFIYDNDKVIDEVLVSYFVSPKSYTTENMCEINSHGSAVVLNKIVRLCIEHGAVLAEPGEFTKKAFLNGRIDLSQAEAVIELINSKTDVEAETSISQVDGVLKNKIVFIKKFLIDAMTKIEVSIDYPEYDVDEVTNNEVLKCLDNVEFELNKLENSFSTGKIIREGVKTVIIGKPNAGKSSLLNAILNEEKAIVTDVEGTTRDLIEEFITVRGIPFKLVDTAGIRDTDDKVEKIGIIRSKEMASKSDLIIAIFDLSRAFDKEDSEILDIIKDKNAIIVLNKSDINNKLINEEKFYYLNKPIVYMSALKNKGIDDLFDCIEKMYKLNEVSIKNNITITNLRHVELIIKAKEHVTKARKSIYENMPIDVVSIELKEIINSLNKITGENVSEEILSEIFKKFCLGK